MRHSILPKKLFYWSGLLCELQPWKHLVNLRDSFPFAVRYNLRGLSGCFTRKCWMYTWKLSILIFHFYSQLYHTILFDNFYKLNIFHSSFIFTWADLYANLISTSEHRLPNHKNTCSPLSSIIISSSAKSSWNNINEIYKCAY